MSIEFDTNAVDTMDFFELYEANEEPDESKSAHFHKVLFSPSHSSSYCLKTTIRKNQQTLEEARIHTMVLKRLAIESTKSANHHQDEHIVLCEDNEGNDRNWVDFSAGAEDDNDGNESVWMGMGYTTKNGTNIEIVGEVKKDSEGNTSRRIEGNVRIPIGN
jgi:hypothetical protein